MRKGLVLVLAAAVLALTACADGQGAFTNSTVSHFTPGVTTRAEAVAQLGPPSSIYDRADGSRIVTWARTGGLFNPSETKGTSILFDPNNKMVQIMSDGSAAQ